MHQTWAWSPCGLMMSASGPARVAGPAAKLNSAVSSTESLHSCSCQHAPPGGRSNMASSRKQSLCIAKVVVQVPLWHKALHCPEQLATASHQKLSAPFAAAEARGCLCERTAGWQPPVAWQPDVSLMLGQSLQGLALTQLQSCMPGLRTPISSTGQKAPFTLFIECNSSGAFVTCEHT